jgi:hypothetical protein
MRFRDLYRHDTPRNILLRGALALAVGLLFCSAYSVFTGKNEFRELALIVFFVPGILTTFNLLVHFIGPAPSTKPEKKD